jgi:hypothetical protein
LVSSLCLCCGIDDIDCESLILSFITDVLINRIQTFISQSDFAPHQKLPLVVRVIITKFKSEGVALVFIRIITTIEDT